MSPIAWYATTRDLKADDRGPLELSDALRVVDEYASRLKPYYESGEEAYAETVFGFSRDSDDFIEIGLNSLTEIAFGVELPPSDADVLWRMREHYFHCDLALDSLDLLKRHVTAYFTMDLDQFKLHLLGGEQATKGAE